MKELQQEQTEEILRITEIVKQNGKLKKGTNEVTKAVERGTAKIVLIASDANPKELVMHIPLLCEEKGVACVQVGSKEELGAAAGLPVATVSIAITDESNAKDDLKKFIDAL